MVTVMEIDSAIAEALRDNGRLPISELALQLGLPRRRVQQRVSALLASKAMRVVANVHPGMLGMRVFADVHLWIDGSTELVTHALRDIPEATFISAVAGSCDAVVELGASNAEHLADLLSRVRQISGVRESASSQLVSVFRSRFAAETERGGEDLPTLDATDLKIIGLLRQDGRMTYRAMSQQVGLSIGAVRLRLAKLTRSGMLNIACELINPDAARPLKMGVGIRLATSGTRAVEALQHNPSVEFASTTLGLYDVVATISGPSTRAVHTTVEQIRRSVGSSRLSTWVHLDVVRESYE